jgi:hypothetical protein
MVEWLYSLPTGQLAIYCSAFFVVVTWLGLIFVRPFLRLWVRRQEACNELVAYAYSGFSVFYGLLIGLLAVAAYQNLEKVQGAVGLEASQLARLYRAAAGYPEPWRSDIQAMLRDYTLYVIQKDWPAQRQGRVNQGGALRMTVIESTLISYEPQTKTQEILHTQNLQAFEDLATARQQRLLAQRIQLPGVLWYVVGIGAGVNLVLFWLLEARFAVHVLLGGIVSLFLGVMIFLLVAMDRPIRGRVGVSADLYQTVYSYVMRWDEK